MTRVGIVYGLTIVTFAVALPAAGAAVINELFVNPPGNDAPNEYIEIRGNANEVLPAGTYLLGIEGDFGANAGDVQDIFDLSGLTLGTNGFLVLLQKGNPYSTGARRNCIDEHRHGHWMGKRRHQQRGAYCGRHGDRHRKCIGYVHAGSGRDRAYAYRRYRCRQQWNDRRISGRLDVYGCDRRA